MKTSGRKENRKFEEAIRFVLDQCGDVFHEWNTKKAREFFNLSGISKRNWSILMRSTGMADGKKWTLRAIAEDEGNISHVRAWQIIRQTRKNLERFALKYSAIAAEAQP